MVKVKPIAGQGVADDRSLSPLIMLLPVPVLVGVVVFLNLPIEARLSLLISAATLCVLAGVGFHTRSRGRMREAMLLDAVPLLVSRDITPALLATAEGEITYANDAAKTRFTSPMDNSVSARFATVVANPDTLIYRLQKKAEAMAAAREDVTTMKGQYRFSVARVSRGMFLWRFDELGDIQAEPKARSHHHLPMLAIGRSDAVLFLNEAFRQILGRRPQTLADVFGPEPLQTGDLRRVKTHDGQVYECIVALVPGAVGRREVYALPAPAAKRVEPETAQAVAQSWQAIEELPVPLLKLTPDGTILCSNREARALLAVSSTDGKHIADILDGLGRPIRDWLREVFENRQGYSSHFMRGRGDKKDTFVQVSLKVSHGIDDGAQIIAVINDVTELKTLEAQFVQSQKMHAIGQLAGGVAHDFNNLLTAISGHCDLLLLRHDQADQDYSDLVQIHQNANRAASLVGQLLAFSRKQNLQPAVIDVRDTLSDLTHLLNRLVGEKVSLTISHDPDLAPIKADRRQLEQVMMNLVVNARDAMPNGGAINVMTSNLKLLTEIERDRAYVPAGDYVEVRVIDKGIGIPPERLPKIFEPFFTTKRTGEGTGLGLSTAYGIVKQTGGYIFADSEVDVGTTFTLLFPRHDAPAEVELKTPVEPVVPPTAPDDAVVLLVEDEAPVRAFASRALRLRGYTVLEADCAEAALNMLSDPELNVDIFVTDVIMPGKDGPTWVREALADRPQTKVVFVSGYSEDAFSDGEAKIPNSVFLPKPFSLNDLATTVHGQLH